MSTTPSIAELQRAIQIQEQIEKLEAELKAVLGGVTIAAPVKTATVDKPLKKKRTMSPEARARIVAAQKARWAKIKGGATPAVAEAASVSKPAKPAKTAKKRAVKKSAKK